MDRLSRNTLPIPLTEGMGDFMKKVLLIGLSVLCVGFVGCNKDTDFLEVTQSEDQIEIAESITTEMVTEGDTQTESVTEQKVAEITQKEKEKPDEVVSEEKDGKQTDKMQQTPKEEVKFEEPKTEVEKNWNLKRRSQRKRSPKKKSLRRKSQKRKRQSATVLMKLLVLWCQSVKPGG